MLQFNIIGVNKSTYELDEWEVGESQFRSLLDNKRHSRKIWCYNPSSRLHLHRELFPSWIKKGKCIVVVNIVLLALNWV